MQPRACLSLWPTEECDWSTWDIWRSTDAVERAIYLGLALMLAYTLFAFLGFLLRYYPVHHELHNSGPEAGANYARNRRRVIAALSRGSGTLKAFGSLAPFLGLAGTCYGILRGAFVGLSMEKHAAQVALIINIAVSLAAAAAGILVAIPAVLSYNFVRSRFEALKQERPAFWCRTNEVAVKLESIRVAQTLPLRKPFSGIPAFAIVAGPALVCIAALFMAFEPYVAPIGLPVLLPSFPCHPQVTDRIVVLRVMENRELFINQEPISWMDLPRRLSAVYSTRAYRELYFLAEDGVSFQTVADAIDAVRNIQDSKFHSLEIKVRLITPQVRVDREKCFAPIRRRLPQRAGPSG